MISKPIMDVTVPEKEKATFECEVSRTNADVKWFKVSKLKHLESRKIVQYRCNT